MLTLQKEIYDGIIAHGKDDYPIEACGYLGKNEDGLVVAQYRMKNIDKSGEHFSFEPAEQFEVVKKIRARGLKAAVVYHSHPETPARPSQEDIRLAFDPNVSYVIVSLAGDKPDVKSFRIVKGTVEKEEIVVTN